MEYHTYRGLDLYSRNKGVSCMMPPHDILMRALHLTSAVHWGITHKCTCHINVQPMLCTVCVIAEMRIYVINDIHQGCIITLKFLFFTPSVIKLQFQLSVKKHRWSVDVKHTVGWGYLKVTARPQAASPPHLPSISFVSPALLLVFLQAFQLISCTFVSSHQSPHLCLCTSP